MAATVISSSQQEQQPTPVAFVLCSKQRSEVCCARRSIAAQCTSRPVFCCAALVRMQACWQAATQSSHEPAQDCSAAAAHSSNTLTHYNPPAPPWHAS